MLILIVAVRIGKSVRMHIICVMIGIIHYNRRRTGWHRVVRVKGDRRMVMVRFIIVGMVMMKDLSWHDSGMRTVLRLRGRYEAVSGRRALLMLLFLGQPNGRLFFKIL